MYFWRTHKDLTNLANKNQILNKKIQGLFLKKKL
jgi:hypothetical protein